MSTKQFSIEKPTLFSKSKVWDLNESYYKEVGIEAWSSGQVPHNMTSSASVGETYAELILGILKDLSRKRKNLDPVYIIELGAGHGRLAYHIIIHLEHIIESLELELPPYCFIISDIVESNLAFFDAHPQFQKYFKKGNLDTAYFDAVNSTEIELRHHNKTLNTDSLSQPIIAIANYFFDSIPSDLLHINNKEIELMQIELNASIDPKSSSHEALLKDISIAFNPSDKAAPFYEDEAYNNIINEYQSVKSDSYFFFPIISLKCISNLKTLSHSGLIVLTMDKGYSQLEDLENRPLPELIIHGSFSTWVNYHALKSYCRKEGGQILEPKMSDFNLQILGLMFVKNKNEYIETQHAYKRYVDDFGPDDYLSLKKWAYKNSTTIQTTHLIALLRLGCYDSNMFMKLLPQLKQLLKSITVKERLRLAQTMEKVWTNYFHINEPQDLANEIAGIFYQLGFYDKALEFYQNSISYFGYKADSYYNKCLCYYQLREDLNFANTLKEGQKAFPTYARFVHLTKLDLDAK